MAMAAKVEEETAEEAEAPNKELTPPSNSPQIVHNQWTRHVRSPEFSFKKKVLVDTASREFRTPRTQLKSLNILPEVLCRSSGKTRRFSSGTEAGFALNLINRKLGSSGQPALYIEAAKEGEEPVSFGPNSLLVTYGKGWILQTAVAEDTEEARPMQSSLKYFPPAMKSVGVHSQGETVGNMQSRISFIYLGKILLAFCFIFLLGGAFTLILENLPRLISLLTSS